MRESDGHILREKKSSHHLPKNISLSGVLFPIIKTQYALQGQKCIVVLRKLRKYNGAQKIQAFRYMTYNSGTCKTLF